MASPAPIPRAVRPPTTLSIVASDWAMTEGCLLRQSVASGATMTLDVLIPIIVKVVNISGHCVEGSPPTMWSGYQTESNPSFSHKTHCSIILLGGPACTCAPNRIVSDSVMSVASRLAVAESQYLVLSFWELSLVLPSFKLWFSARACT